MMLKIFKKSGEIPWTKATVAVSAGLKNGMDLQERYFCFRWGQDCAWIDMIDFAQSSPVRYIQRDLQVARVIIPVNNDNMGWKTLQ